MKDAYRVPGIMNCEQSGYYIEGPGNGFSYNAGLLWPSFSFPTTEEAQNVAKMVNEAYRQGYWAAQAEMRKALGMKS